MTQPIDPELRRGPLLQLLGMHSSVLRPGAVEVTYEVGAEHLRTLGVAHGGVIATLMDTALGLAASSMAPDDLDVVTAQLNLNFIRPAWHGESLVATGETRHSGRRTAVATGEVRTRSGELIATGSATLVFLPAHNLSRREEGR